MTDEVDYGPLAALIGVWQGDSGMDIAPEPDGIEESPYFETITFEAGGDLQNAETQRLAIVPYTQVVSRKSNGEVFHHQFGYWLYDAADGSIMQTLTIPRGVCLLAGGKATVTGSTTVLEVSAKAGDTTYGVVQSPFMEKFAKTVSFSHRLEVTGDEMSYSESTILDIYGKSAFDHGDSNKLKRVG
ncbi:heme-binding beta-barrel domain-containing protein [Halioxenophilus sp. WMMB6]|uniref:heme-binding beta-barrel domain-containing protein n=1 Tax=Halioxenophilus sp. WMMB6 TaxID=3073815 RepID=UPI00295E3F2D|nr:heme-binding beta-barrel domain-containing protein [Halioxenophilus sp. WMMB6]